MQLLRARLPVASWLTSSTAPVMIPLRSLRSVSFVLLLVATGCGPLSSGSKGPPAPATGTDVVQRMRARYDNTWFRTLSFTQENTRYLANGRTEKSQWKEYLQVPGRLRIEFMPATGNNGAIYADGSVYSFEGGRLSHTVQQFNVLLVLTADVYGQPAETSVKQLRTLGVDLTKLRSDKWNGRKVWVVGSTGGPDVASSQFWIDAETWTALRVIDRAVTANAQGARPSTEYRLADYRMVNDIPVVHEITFLRDNKPFFKEQYTEVVLNTPLDARLFSPSQWKIPGRTP